MEAAADSSRHLREETGIDDTRRQPVGSSVSGTGNPHQGHANMAEAAVPFDDPPIARAHPTNGSFERRLTKGQRVWPKQPM
jgi:hypothetical protein